MSHGEQNEPTRILCKYWEFRSVLLFFTVKDRIITFYKSSVNRKSSFVKEKLTKERYFFEKIDNRWELSVVQFFRLIAGLESDVYAKLFKNIDIIGRKDHGGVGLAAGELIQILDGFLRILACNGTD